MPDSFSNFIHHVRLQFPDSVSKNKIQISITNGAYLALCLKSPAKHRLAILWPPRVQIGTKTRELQGGHRGEMNSWLGLLSPISDW